MQSASNNRKVRPPPPRPPAYSPPHAPKTVESSRSFPTGLKIALIVLTLIGVYFAIRAVSVLSGSNQSPDTSRTESPTGTSDAAEGETRKSETVSTTSVAKTEETGSNASEPATMNSESTGSQQKADVPRLRIDGLNIELGNIERTLDAQSATPDTTVYQRISENIRQCLQIQLAILKNTEGVNETNTDYARIQSEFAALQQLNDAPYYTSMIAAYSRLVAEASVTACSRFIGETKTEESQRLKSELIKLRRSSIEATCDATFVTATALLCTSKAQSGSTQGSLIWQEIERNIQTQRASEQHIIRKTEMAHRTLCDVIKRAIIARNQTGKTTETVARIERERDIDIAKATDSFFRLAAYTEAEARLMVLWAHGLK